jgi:hypothetical protein
MDFIAISQSLPDSYWRVFDKLQNTAIAQGWIARRPARPALL